MSRGASRPILCPFGATTSYGILAGCTDKGNSTPTRAALAVGGT